MNRWLLILNYNQYTTQLTVPSNSSLCLLPHLNSYMVIIIWGNIQVVITMHIFSNVLSTLHSCMPHNIIYAHQGSQPKLSHTNLLNANCSLHTCVCVLEIDRQTAGSLSISQCLPLIQTVEFKMSWIKAELLMLQHILHAAPQIKWSHDLEIGGQCHWLIH
jgi:hypothetical protein